MTERREQYIEGLRLFADFLTEHPDYPATQNHCVTYKDDEQGVAEVYRLAAILGADVRPPGEHSRHWIAARRFAGLTVEIVYCTQQSMADYNALHTYDANLRGVPVGAL